MANGQDVLLTVTILKNGDYKLSSPYGEPEIIKSGDDLLGVLQRGVKGAEITPFSTYLKTGSGVIIINGVPIRIG